jgi:hypothetical protein
MSISDPKTPRAQTRGHKVTPKRARHTSGVKQKSNEVAAGPVVNRYRSALRQRTRAGKQHDRAGRFGRRRKHGDDDQRRCLHPEIRGTGNRQRKRRGRRRCAATVELRARATAAGHDQSAASLRRGAGKLPKDHDQSQDDAAHCLHSSTIGLTLDLCNLFSAGQPAPNKGWELSDEAAAVTAARLRLGGD